MSTVETRKFEPATGTAVNLGASGDAVTLPAGVTLQTNTIKDAGGNTIFTSDGAGNLSSVNSALQGNMVFISSQTASGVTGVEFTSGIDSTYDEYVFYYVNINPATNNGNFGFNTSTDGGSNYNTTKTTTFFRADSAANFGYVASWDLAQSTARQPLTLGIGNPASDSASGMLHLFAPSSTTYVKQFYSRANMIYHSADESIDVYVAGYMNSTSAINAIQFDINTGNFDGTVYLYGIK